MQRFLKKLDLYRHTPGHVKIRGTIIGGLLSIATIIIIIIFMISSMVSLSEIEIINDLRVDNKNSTELLNITIDIQLPKFPCAVLSFDIQNMFKMRIINDRHIINKFTLPQNLLYTDVGLDEKQKKQNFLKQLRQQKGCRVSGKFQVERIPGNFHISIHDAEYSKNAFGQGLRKFNLQHKINQLYFGNHKTKSTIQNSLRGFEDHESSPNLFIGNSFSYFIKVMQKYHFQIDGSKTLSYQYVSTNYQLKQFNFIPLIYFQYYVSPIYVLEIQNNKKDVLDFFIEMIGVIGGIAMVSKIIDQFLHYCIVVKLGFLEEPLLEKNMTDLKDQEMKQNVGSRDKQKSIQRKYDKQLVENTENNINITHQIIIEEPLPQQHFLQQPVKNPSDVNQQFELKQMKQLSKQQRQLHK